MSKSLIRSWLLSAIGAAAVSAVAFAPTSASAAPDLCESGISKAVGAVASGVQKNVQKCNDTIRKTEVKILAGKSKDPTGDRAKAAASCNGTLAKTFGIADAKSVVGKNFAALTKLTTGGTKAKCQDADLLSLGHIPTGVAGDNWARAAVLAGVNNGLDAQVQSAAGTATNFRAALTTGSCPRCDLFQGGNGTGAAGAAGDGGIALGVNGPCSTLVCKLDPTSSSLLNLAIPSYFGGNWGFGACADGDILPGGFVAITNASSDATQAAIGAPPGLGVPVCVAGIRSQGLIDVGGVLPAAFDTTTCQDSLTGDSTDGALTDECPTVYAGAGCSAGAAASSLDPAAGSSEGGSCLLISPAAPGAGSAFVINTISLTPNSNPLDYGADTIPCTADDTVAPGSPATIPFTTETASSQVLDFNSSLADGPVTSATGANFSASALAQGKLVGTVVAAFPGMNTNLGGGTITDTFIWSKLICAP